MAKLSFTDFLLIVLVFIVLIACTVLALLLGYVLLRESKKKEPMTTTTETQTYFVPFTFSSVEVPSELPTTQTISSASAASTAVSISSSSETQEENNDELADELRDDENFELYDAITTQVEEKTPDCECPPLSKPQPPADCPYPQQLSIAEGILIPKKPTTTFITEYPYLVSLSEKMYTDDESGLRKFVCTGIAIESNRVLTGSCYKNAGDFHQANVRSGSDQWSKGGKLHSVVNIQQPKFSISGLHLLTVNPPFSDWLPVADMEEVWDYAEAFGWYQDPLLPVLDNTPVTKTVSYKELACNNSVCTDRHNLPCDDSDIGHPLVANGKLVGIVTGRGCKRYTKYRSHSYHFTDLTNPIYNRWLLPDTRRFKPRRYY